MMPHSERLEILRVRRSPANRSTENPPPGYVRELRRRLLLGQGRRLRVVGGDVAEF